MSLCAVCGMQLGGAATLCAHHDGISTDGWAVVNRVMCDLLHRGIVPPRLTARERAEDFPTPAEAA